MYLSIPTLSAVYKPVFLGERVSPPPARSVTQVAICKRGQVEDYSHFLKDEIARDGVPSPSRDTRILEGSSVSRSCFIPSCCNPRLTPTRRYHTHLAIRPARSHRVKVVMRLAPLPNDNCDSLPLGS